MDLSLCLWWRGGGLDTARQVRHLYTAAWIDTAQQEDPLQRNGRRFFFGRAPSTCRLAGSAKRVGSKDCSEGTGLMMCRDSSLERSLAMELLKSKRLEFT